MVALVSLQRCECGHRESQHWEGRHCEANVSGGCGCTCRQFRNGRPPAPAALRKGAAKAAVATELAAEVVLHYCQNSHCGGYSPRPPQQRQPLPYRGTGRPPKYCSDACKQADYRFRRQLAEREAERRRDEAERAERQRRADAKAAEIMANVRGVIQLELARTKLAKGAKAELAAAIQRSLELAGLIEISAAQALSRGY